MTTKKDTRSKRVSTAAIIPSPIKDRWAVPLHDAVKGESSDKKRRDLDMDKLKAVIDSNASKINDAAGIMELLPDLNLVKEVLVASILSPKDLKPIELKVTTGNHNISGLAEAVRSHLTSDYDLESALPDILGKALFTHGSYSLLPLPALTIHNLIKDHSINLEAIKESDIEKLGATNIGILAGRRGESLYAMEALSDALGSLTINKDVGKMPDLVTISDNALQLLKPAMRDIKNYGNKCSALENHYGLEGLNASGKIDKDVSPYIKRRYKSLTEIYLRGHDNNLVVDPNTAEHDEKKAGDVDAKLAEAFAEINPIVINPPMESVIPVHVPGEPHRHVGYYIAIDSRGNPISRSKDSNFFKELNDRLKVATLNKSDSDYITAALGYSTKTSEIELDPLLSAYEEKLECALREAVERGVHNDTVEISAPGEFYRTMFSRQLAMTKTSFIYIPEEMMTYFAFNYNAIGCGVSLLEKTKLYSSLRAILLFANVMAGVKNSVAKRILTITLDEHDTDPQATVETVLNEFISLQTKDLPLGELNPSGIVDSLQRAGIQIKIDGGEIFPNTALDLEETQRDRAVPDTDLEENLKFMQYAGLGVAPETIDSARESDFATGITKTNLLQSKRVLVWQKKYTSDLSDFAHKYIYAGGPLYATIKELYDADKDRNKASLQEVIESIAVELPQPDTASIESQMEAYEAYSGFVELAVNAYVSDEMVDSMLGGEHVMNSIDNVRQTIISYLKRQYMRKQNMLPELSNLFTNEEFDPVPGITQTNDDVMKIASKILAKLKKSEWKADRKVIQVVDRIQTADADAGEDALDDPEPTSEPSEEETVIDTSKDSTDDGDDDNDGLTLDI